jgi:hypothetical protein
MANPSPTSTTTQQIAQVSQYLAANAKRNKSALGWSFLKGDDTLPELLEIVRNTTNWARTYYSSTTQFALTCNYMVSLIGKYYNQAYAIVTNTSNTGTIVVNPTTGISSLKTIFYQFLPTDTGAPLTTGQTTFTLNIGSGSIFQSGTFQIVVDQVVLPRNNNNYFSYNVSYAAGIITVTLNQAALATQLYQITGTYLTLS